MFAAACVCVCVCVGVGCGLCVLSVVLSCVPLAFVSAFVVVFGCLFACVRFVCWVCVLLPLGFVFVFVGCCGLCLRSQRRCGLSEPSYICYNTYTYIYIYMLELACADPCTLSSGSGS